MEIVRCPVCYHNKEAETDANPLYSIVALKTKPHT